MERKQLHWLGTKKHFGGSVFPTSTLQGPADHNTTPTNRLPRLRRHQTSQRLEDCCNTLPSNLEVRKVLYILAACLTCTHAIRPSPLKSLEDFSHAHARHVPLPTCHANWTPRRSLRNDPSLRNTPRRPEALLMVVQGLSEGLRGPRSAVCNATCWPLALAL